MTTNRAHAARESESQQRVSILNNTLHKLRIGLSATAEEINLAQRNFEQTFLDQAQRNLSQWKAQAEQKQKIQEESKSSANPGPLEIEVVEEDWGVAAQRLTQETGEIFAVLNMANAESPGGAYLRGAAAQEENMMRRSNGHLEFLREAQEGKINELRNFQGQIIRNYTPAMTDLINAKNNEVHLDKSRPLVCLRGPEKRNLSATGVRVEGYQDLAPTEIFPFYELRSAAYNYRDGSAFNEADARRRIGAQLDTLIKNQVKNVVLSAFGCGAFSNPPELIAKIYREELEKRSAHFNRVTFAIYYAGYGLNNFAVFRAALDPYPLPLKLQTALNDFSSAINTGLHNKDLTPKQAKDLKQELYKLHLHIQNVTPRKNLAEANTFIPITNLANYRSTVEAIDQFKINALNILSNPKRTTGQKIIIALSALVGAAIGFALGFAAGLWSGPGAFVSGALGSLKGAAIAASIVGASAALGGGLGFWATAAANQRKKEYAKSLSRDVDDLAEEMPKTLMHKGG